VSSRSPAAESSRPFTMKMGHGGGWARAAKIDMKARLISDASCGLVSRRGKGTQPPGDAPSWGGIHKSNDSCDDQSK
jgi:hypothetical protein